MSAYYLKKPNGSYDLVDLNTVTMTNQIVSNTDLTFEVVVRKLMALHYDNSNIADLWKGEFDCHFIPQARKQNFGINVLGNFLLLTQSAYNFLGDKIHPFGEFVKINADGESLMLFNPKVFAKEDPTLCEMNYVDGFEDGVKSLVFLNEDIQNKLLFKSKLQGGDCIYCNEVFKRLIVNSELEGLSFDSDLLNPF
ncbi:hypothetical protein [Shewanella vesiculosa]|uniref:hypothetical protein n=1 Tax=Shewanella vesiculosa TaxID=518738 RepID=UPI00384D34FB